MSKRNKLMRTRAAIHTRDANGEWFTHEIAYTIPDTVQTAIALIRKELPKAIEMELVVQIPLVEKDHVLS